MPARGLRRRPRRRGGVGGFQCGLGVVPARASRRWRLGVLGCLGGPARATAVSPGLAAGGVGCSQCRGDRPGSAASAGRRHRRPGRRPGEQLVQPASAGGVVPAGREGGLADWRCRCATGVSTAGRRKGGRAAPWRPQLGAASGLLAAARASRRCRLPGRAGCGIWSGIWLVMAGPFFFFALGTRKGMKRKSGDEIKPGMKGRPRGAPGRAACFRGARGTEGRSGPGAGGVAAASRPAAVSRSRWRTRRVRANRPGRRRPPRPGAPPGCSRGVLEHRLDLGDVDDVDVQGRAQAASAAAGRSVSPARSAGRPTASSSTARRRPAAAARRSGRRAVAGGLRDHAVTVRVA